MADSEHTLHLTAKLDTSEVQQQLDKLNSGKQQQSQAQNESYSSRYFNTIIPAAFTGLSKTLYSRFTGESKKFGKQLDQTIKDMTNGAIKSFKQARAFLDKIHEMNKKYEELYNKAVLVESNGKLLANNKSVFSPVAKKNQQILTTVRKKVEDAYKELQEFTEKKEKLIYEARQSGIAKLFYEGDRERLSGGLPYPRRPQTNFSKILASKRKNPISRELVKWGAGYALMQLADETASAAGQVDSPLAKGISSGADVLQGAIMGAGTGAPVGPLGAAAGFAAGSIIGVIKQIFQTIRQQSEQTLSEVQQNMKIGYQRRKAALADIAAIRSMKTDFAFSKELEAIQAAGLPEAEKTFAMLVSSISQIDAKIQGGKYRSVGELSSLLQQRQDAQQARGVALSRVQELRGQQQAEAEAETRRREAEYENQKQLTELRRMSKFRIHISEMAQNGDIQQLRSLYAGFAKHMTAAQDVETWQRASLGMSIVSSGIQQADSLKLKDLQERLAMTAPVDLTPVTSLGQYGYGMGEVNDNIERQMHIWEEQAQLQRDIRDILDSRSFPGVYE